MKFQKCISINFVTDARTDACTDGQAKSNMPLQLFQSWGHNNQDILMEFPEDLFEKFRPCKITKYVKNKLIWVQLNI